MQQCVEEAHRYLAAAAARRIELNNKRCLSDEENNSILQQLKLQLNSLKSQLQEEREARLQAEGKLKDCKRNSNSDEDIIQSLRVEVQLLKEEIVNLKVYFGPKKSTLSTEASSLPEMVHAIIIEAVEEILFPILATRTASPKQPRGKAKQATMVPMQPTSGNINSTNASTSKPLVQQSPNNNHGKGNPINRSTPTKLRWVKVVQTPTYRPKVVTPKPAMDTTQKKKQ